MDSRAASPELDAADRPHWRRDVAVFLSGQAVSLFGSMIVQYAVMWYITLTTKDGVAVAMSAVFGFLPQAIISIFGGVWADRHNRKLLIMGSDAVIALTTLVLALLMLSGRTDLWLIFCALAVRSAGAGIQTPAVGALIPQLVPTTHLMTINGLNQSIQSGLMLIGPAVAALLYSVLPIGAVFFVDVGTAIIGIGLLALVPVGKVARSSEAVSYFGDLVEGARYAAGHGLVRWLLGLNAVVMVLAAAPSYLTPLMVANTFGDEVWKLTVLELSFSVGMLIAGATVGLWGARLDRIRLIFGSAIAFGILSIALGLSPNLWVFYVFMFLTGAVVPAFSTPSMTVLQESVEPERQGRVFGLFGIVSAVAMPLGMAVFGPLAEVWSVQVVLVLAGVATFAAAVLAVSLPVGRAALREARAVAGGPSTGGTPTQA
ncbi:MFS transporter [Propionicicella superfundia]|uniref:MFS transporter n=1 Tax=Propionicicella superfundia TaxID=348582 RepID=UPI0003F53FDC|nr:MFS transporter [Propionicicella superfundia]